MIENTSIDTMWTSISKSRQFLESNRLDLFPTRFRYRPLFDVGNQSIDVFSISGFSLGKTFIRLMKNSTSVSKSYQLQNAVISRVVLSTLQTLNDENLSWV